MSCSNPCELLHLAEAHHLRRGFVKGARACLAYEKPGPTARLLAKFIELRFGGAAAVAPVAVALRSRPSFWIPLCGG